jgi:hypothetical protein
MPRVYIGGIKEGVNFPKDNGESFHIDTDKCNDLIVVDRKYFLEHMSLLHSWALNMEQTAQTRIK